MIQNFRVRFDGDDNRESVGAVINISDDFSAHSLFTFDITQKWKTLIAETYAVPFASVFTEEEYLAHDAENREVDDYLESLHEDEEYTDSVYDESEG